MLENFIIGFHEAVSWHSLFLMSLGAVWGFIGGALPGINASTAMALILPLTWTMRPSGALMMLAAVYVTAEYSGSVPAILIHTPGTSSAVVTTFDGYPMQQQGKGAKALSISLFSGFTGQIMANIMLIALVLPLSHFALAFGPPEFFALALFGLTLVASLGEKSVLKALISGTLGVAFATVGLDPFNGTVRYGFGVLATALLFRLSKWHLSRSSLFSQRPTLRLEADYYRRHEPAAGGPPRDPVEEDAP